LKPCEEEIIGFAFSTNNQERVSMGKVTVSLVGTLDSTMCGAKEEVCVLRISNNAIQMKQNGGNR
jgi:hypothetical protein